MSIITVNREFGSGGRELAKRLAEELGYRYYDKDIFAMVAKKQGLNKEYVEETMTNAEYAGTIGRSFNTYLSSQKSMTDMLVEERNIIRKIGEKGNCVIVGRGTDVILSDLSPVDIFVYADTDTKLKRCKEHGHEGEDLSEKELIKKIKQVDKSRKRFYLFLGQDNWGEKENYDLCVNTSGVNIKEMIPELASLTKKLMRKE